MKFQEGGTVGDMPPQEWCIPYLFYRVQLPSLNLIRE